MGGGLRPVDQLGVPWEVGTTLATLYLMTCFQVGLASLWSRKQLRFLNSFHSAASFVDPLVFALLYFEMFSYQNVFKKYRKKQMAYFIFWLYVIR